MITIRRSHERGHADHGWLDTYHTFSFANYYDPEWLQFGPLRVLNQDRVEPGRGFGTHGHRDMEIVSVVLDGVMEHRDDAGNGSQLRPGDVQLMSAGGGIQHSEFNASATESLHFLQMWIIPERLGGAPRYEQKHFATEERTNTLRLAASPDGAEGSLTIGQDARLYTGLIQEDQTAELELRSDRSVWLHTARGRVEVNGEILESGDGAAIAEVSTIEITGRGGADSPAEVILWEIARTGLE